MLAEIALGLIFLLFVNWWLMKPFYFMQKNIPYNLPVPIFGNALGELLDSYHCYWTKKYNIAKKNGGLMGYHLFSKRALVVADPQIVREIMIDQFDKFNSRGMPANPSVDPFARSVFLVEGDDWKRIRSKLTPYFSPSRLKSMTQLMSSNVKEYVNKFEEAANCKKSINVNDISLKLSTDIVVNTIFGIKPDSFTNPNSFFFLLQAKLLDHQFIVKQLLGYISPTLYDMLRITSFSKEITLKLTGFIKKVMDQRSKGIGVRQDFIQGMHEIVQKDLLQSQDHKNGGNKGFGMAEATAQSMAMYSAGTETTGNALSYLLYEIAIHQEIQDKVREEISKVLAATDEGIFTYDVFGEFTYTTMVIHETLRKYPILGVISRSCIKATKLAGIDIEPGVGIFIPVMGFHRDPELYPEPEKFIPERFAKEDSKDLLYLSFGLGPRTCIGMKMGLIEIVHALCEVIPKFKVQPCDKSKGEIVFNWKPTLNPLDGVWLDVERL